MKAFLIIASLILFPYNPFKQSIKIGKFTYQTKKTYVFLKDESYHATGLSLYKDGQHQAGLITQAKRNDTLFFSGSYRIDSNKFIVKNIYHIKLSYDPDSSIKVFAQNVKGELKLKTYFHYNNGVMIDKLY